MHSVAKQVELDWPKVHRLVASQYPPIDLFEQVANPDDLAIVFELDALTNDRLLAEVGDLWLVPKEQRIAGPGTSPIMAAFTHIGYPSRFTDGTAYGVYYGAKDTSTAVAETCYHREKFLAATQEPDTVVTMREYVNQVVLPLDDISDPAYAGLLTDDYQPAQLFARQRRQAGSHGLHYPSVRQPGGRCIAIFNPRALTPTTQAGHYQYHWCGTSQKINHVLRIELL